MDDATIRAYILANAIKYDGKASAGAIIGQLIAQDPTVKDRMKDVAKKINELIKDVNKLGLEKQKAELMTLKPELLAPKPKEEKKRELPVLEGAVKGKVVTRIAPEPSKYLHMGHTIAFLVNEMEARLHDGQVILRFDDTNPEKETQEYVDSTKEDLAWLGIKPDQEIYASDCMDDYYEKAERLIKQKDAYVCFCKQETMRELRFAGKPCACRDASVDDNLSHWKAMLDGNAKEGSCVLRLKGDMENQNATLRDPVIVRIVEAPHYRHSSKYKAWPMYDFECAIIESMTGVTHVLRSAEFELRIALQDLIRNKLDLPAVPAIEFGRINVTGALTQGRDIRAKIESGEYTGWDDPRLVTIKTLRRRGITPAAFRELIYDLGFGTGQVNLDFSILSAINRKIIDPTTPRRFFVAEPVAVVIEGAPAKEAHLPVHPQNPDMGTRTLPVKAGQKVFITAEDSKRTDKLLRLMDYCNVTRKGNKETSFVFDSPDIETFREKGGAIIHWLPDDQTVPCEVMMPDATVVKGVAEASIKDLKVGSLVQFERFGFCRLDAVEGKGPTTTYKFWFTHK